MYDTSDGGREFRKYTSCNLAWWHSYKHCCIQIWKVFANMIWAPLYHDLYPNSRFFIEGSSMPNMVSHFVYMWLAYQNSKQQLEDALVQDGLTLKSKIALEDVRFLCEFAIPVVRHNPHPAHCIDCTLSLLSSLHKKYTHTHRRWTTTST